MITKSKIYWKYCFYLLLAFFWLLYPGQQSLLKKAGLNYSAFIQNQPIKFKPEALPRLTDEIEKPLVFAQSYLVIDLSSFTPILSYRPVQKMYPASLVKLATAIVSYQHYPLEQQLTVNKVINEELKMGLVKNERISALNLLYGILVYSANDAAYTLAENYPGGVEPFVQEMNLLAKRLEMKNTHFTNPIGFDSPKQYTTAFDLALLSREFINNQVLLNIASTKSITVSDADFEHFHYLNSINELLGEIPHLGGLKTGTTDNAGQNLISFYRLNKKPLLLIVLKSEDRFVDTRALIDYLNSNLVFIEIT
ncbi:hypothetical protein A2313_01805 [Candidatus Roizmanbacteria bacterium RIFOXYB2_FULL_41_10]|uniref:Peptidase S11 D-alanyl-D-alanine carboxypeptidase A N-terminal domain-containing protein n=1 Tax=Candidatus Roizmanbacteria bacterium RIFOXYA1_FULL_41_12 TaxID=1802082 RepID=A0A1F7K5L8_9BACT|nr:MAG: hypothetical protein A2209_02860 [Candidatus Roizmanbacteria bacterium RIFOXYA1_FULL_41_12]OGK66669.1 MAG: hypothetical protein A2262_03450 [Candidatus Roizmanbacteria bacterium RIFOXYA2_FULL_41_8]OGK67525.1 MAG: hypothetical protein A2377_01610 [Candidatus Roizmanbacteria bacterium RIFOXYB1_FULL_41_27]OGK71181.1 MAG: hypothetical protein A2403_00340 [Candidatus Roizmanbacteria bacterium RIFOXYC1_FULL_41_16]OGK72059.1 MAG: hypothetical protein A2313_01805 [Candidatus Roizmanbacteria bac